MQIDISSVDELAEVAKAILTNHPSKTVFLFNGDMGAGKTTLIKELCQALEVEDDVSSPTFGFVNEYRSAQGSVFHFDFYRLENSEEAYAMGAEEYFFSGSYCFVEWPDLIKEFLPEQEKCLTIDIFVTEEGRSISF